MKRQTGSIRMRDLCVFLGPRRLRAGLLALLLAPSLLTNSSPRAQTPINKADPARCAPNAPVPVDRWQGEYFNNRDLQGLPAMTRNDGDGAISFDWGLKSPDAECGVNSDDFSVRWTRVVAFGAGAYRFTVAADDGARVFIDGKKQFDEWRDQPATTHSFDIAMTAGNHEVVFEYYERAGSATAQLHWTPAPCDAQVAARNWRGEYFNNRELKGKPALARDDGDGFLDFDWGTGGPGNCSVAADDFSARWTRTVAFADGVYRFNLNADDGVRLYIDGKLEFDRWLDQMASHTIEKRLAAGNHQIVVEYYEHAGSAAVKLWWEQHPCFSNVPPDHWRGEYFDNPNLNGSPKMVRDDGADALDFDFALNSPGGDCGIPADNFSARWTRAVATSAGTYRFTLTADDGVRLFIDGRKQLDEWRHQQPTTFVVDVALTAGNHRTVVEYYDHTGGAVAKLNWQLIARAFSPRRAR